MIETNYYIGVGQTIKELRIKKNMTKTQLADGICSPSYITRIENGERCPTSVILRQITNKLGVNPEHLFRVIESPTALHIRKIINQLFIYGEQGSLKSIHQLIKNEEYKFKSIPIHDLQIIKLFKSISNARLNKNYESGIAELTDILKLTYIKEHRPTDVEFIIMVEIYCLSLLNNQNEEAYSSLIQLKKYTDNINLHYTYAVIPRFYVYLISACFDTLNLLQTFPYIDYAINYCKKNNVYAVLPELYFLKGEYYYHFNKEKEFKVWFNKAFTFHELIKYSNDTYFEVFVNNRLKYLNIS